MRTTTTYADDHDADDRTEAAQLGKLGGSHHVRRTWDEDQEDDWGDDWDTACTQQQGAGLVVPSAAYDPSEFTYSTPVVQRLMDRVRMDVYEDDYLSTLPVCDVTASRFGRGLEFGSW